jgi:hypothetical protein
VVAAHEDAQWPPSDRTRAPGHIPCACLMFALPKGSVNLLPRPDSCTGTTHKRGRSIWTQVVWYGRGNFPKKNQHRDPQGGHVLEWQRWAAQS